VAAVSADKLDEAVAALAAGQVVGIPTDTVYGLAVDPSRPGSVDAIFALKARPGTVEIPLLVADLAQADRVAVLDGPARRLAECRWPGGLTIVVARRPGVDWPLGGDGTSVGVRCPAHDLVRDLSARAGPLAVTSANLHGEPPLHEAAALRAAFGDGLGALVDGGTCAGAPSTVADLRSLPPRCLRQGSMPWDDVLAALDEP
jgi:tRNA threonylcarbamoyl adenosine modification protein (Sua5/YciO/YrdC/YwlC family)